MGLFFFFNLLILAVLALHCCSGFSLVAVTGYSLVPVCSFSLRRLLLWRTGSRVCGFRDVAPGCGAQASVAVAPWLGAPRREGSAQARDQTHVCCIGRQILYH